MRIHSKHDSTRAFSWPRLASLAIILLLAGRQTRAAEVDLTGRTFKNGGKIAASSATTVPGALLYDIRFEANGTGTGTFGFVFGTGDLAARLDQLQPGSSSKLKITLANIPGKLPVVLGQTLAFDQLFGVPVAAEVNDGQFVSKGKIKAQIAKNGIVKVSATGMNFKAANSSNRNVAVTGGYELNSGKVVVEPSPATSQTPRPDFILLLNKHFTIGNDEYETSAPGTIDVTRLKRGRTKSLYFIVQNDGPASDTFVLRSLFPSSGASLRVFDGKTEITDQVAPAAGGYSIPNLASGGTKLFRMVMKVESDAAPGSTQSAGVRISRSADAALSDTGGINAFVQ
jgi:hypothetical protein